MFPLPSRLAESVAREAAPARREWLAALPRIVRGLAERWSLTVGEPFQPGGEVSWVAPARDAGGRDLVLKIGWRHADGEHEADGLRAWHGRGAVEVHAAHVDGPTSALLLECCLPGTPLGEAMSEPDQDVVVAGVLRRLWHVPAAGHPFRLLTQMCDEWAGEFDVAYATEPGTLDPGIARAGIGLYRDLPREPWPQRLLATDLHAGNVLAARREPWLVIDPKPHVGDPCYDVLAHMLNCPERLVTDPAGLSARMAALTGLDAERVRLWLFARSVQESPQLPWLRPVATAIGQYV